MALLGVPCTLMYRVPVSLPVKMVVLVFVPGPTSGVRGYFTAPLLPHFPVWKWARWVPTVRCITRKTTVV